jgi:hypothetical protein
MRRCLLIRYEFCPLGSSLKGQRHYCFTKTLDIRFRHRRSNFEETLAYIQFRMFCAFLYYLGNQKLTLIYLYIYLLFIIYFYTFTGCLYDCKTWSLTRSLLLQFENKALWRIAGHFPCPWNVGYFYIVYYSDCLRQFRLNQASIEISPQKLGY